MAEPYRVTAQPRDIPKTYQPWCRLAEAVIAQAAKDYKDALNGTAPNYTSGCVAAEFRAAQIEHWFLNDAGMILMGLEPEMLLKKIRSERCSYEGRRRKHAFKKGRK